MVLLVLCYLSQILISLRAGTLAETNNTYVKHWTCSRNGKSELIHMTIQSWICKGLFPSFKEQNWTIRLHVTGQSLTRYVTFRWHYKAAGHIIKDFYDLSALYLRLRFFFSPSFFLLQKNFWFWKAILKTLLNFRVLRKRSRDISI